MRAVKAKTTGELHVEDDSSHTDATPVVKSKRKHIQDQQYATQSLLVAEMTNHGVTKEALYVAKAAFDAEKLQHAATKTEHVGASMARKNEHVAVVTKLNRTVVDLKKALSDVRDKLTTSSKLLKVSEENNAIHRQTIVNDFHKIRVLRAAGVCNCQKGEGHDDQLL
jgi:predicted O-linked N-acetylglucosamine transferase (SPINDLY family)